MAQQKDIVTFHTLLAAAHDGGRLVGIHTTAITVEKDFCLFSCVVTMQEGDRVKTFSGHGDATPGNVAPAMQKCLPRLAETRAIVRALRWATNVGQASAEELPDYADNDGDGKPAATPRAATPPASAPTTTTPGGKRINTTGAACPTCHAPDGKPHGAKCTA